MTIIEFETGNILGANAEALVNTVNCLGVMGRGIALQFKEAFPENFKAYETACKHKEVNLGHMFVTERRDMLGPRWIVNFPTKGNWRFPSRIEWIETGLQDLKRVIAEKGIQSIAIPPLGCGLGGLAWTEVRSRIVEALYDLDGLRVIVFEPALKESQIWLDESAKYTERFKG